MDKKEPEKMLTALELSEFLSVPVSWVWKASREGLLPHLRLPGGRRFLRFNSAEVLEGLAPQDDRPVERGQF